jgi:hypothetical protein
MGRYTLTPFHRDEGMTVAAAAKVANKSCCRR